MIVITAITLVINSSGLSPTMYYKYDKIQCLHATIAMILVLQDGNNFLWAITFIDF